MQVVSANTRICQCTNFYDVLSLQADGDGGV